ncbi:glycoside hydrolase family 99-like domain-containing protein [soil metagenome]
MKIKPIAIHLPQFHPFHENDTFWGKGFTEWTNVAKARPLFKGHYQPHIPSDLGFYDLRLEETRIDQADLARQYGIHGFCYYHYWFNGKRLMHRPFDDMLKTKTPEFPFMLCWANENWTRRWDGLDSEILMKQDYSPEDDKNHIRFLLSNFFTDERYIRVDCKPFILIYRPALFPDIKRTLETWREEAHAFGLGGLHIGYMQSFGFREDPKTLGFDCCVDFQPDFSLLSPRTKLTFKQKALFKLGFRKQASDINRVYSYNDYVDQMIRLDKPVPDTYRMVTPMWDNSPRKKTGASLFHDSTPAKYESWLKHAVSVTLEEKLSENFVFINAWNEWAEGNHLEPCLRWQRQYLEATKRAIDSVE